MQLHFIFFLPFKRFKPACLRRTWYDVTMHDMNWLIMHTMGHIFWPFVSVIMKLCIFWAFSSQSMQRVKKLLPRDLQNSRNKEEMTAQELFTKNHEPMVSESGNQLKGLAGTCSGLLAAVVFATSFSIPETWNKEEFRKMTACKIFPHAYEIGLSCATTSLV